MDQFANNRRGGSAQGLADTFDVHAALVLIEAERPYLKNNPRWQLIRMDAFEAFYRAMGDA